MPLSFQNITIQNSLKDSGYFSPLHLYFSQFITQLAQTDNDFLFLAAALVSLWTERGHICLDLSTIANKPLAHIIQTDDVVYHSENNIICPPLSIWIKQLLASPVIGEPGERKPFVLDQKYRLYLYRYWEYEHKLIYYIRKHIKKKFLINQEVLNEGLAKHFPHSDCSDLQYQAAKMAVNQGMSIISGGPGTGKTTVVVKILALLYENYGPKYKIAIVAPTGKAAARLEKSIKDNKQNLACREDILSSIPEKTATIHRLLGSISNSPYFVHNENKNLDLDAVIVDEASMVDLPLMSKLFQALPISTRIILLGDRDQLASVAPGSVLGDLCESQPHFLTNNNKTIADCTVILKKSYRFHENSAIAKVSQLVNKGKGEKTFQYMAPMFTSSEIIWHDLPSSNTLENDLKAFILSGFQDYLNAKDVGDANHLFNKFRILCVLNNGPYGVHAINRLTERILYQQKWINPTMRWYHKQPIMITQNNYTLNLYNGDTGIIYQYYDPNTKHSSLRAYFFESNGIIRHCIPARLSHCETVFAMTVHKSQGSEFDDVLLILPDHPSPILTRELIYTGITRAKKRVHIWGKQSIYSWAVKKRIRRTSGLKDAINPSENKLDLFSFNQML